MIQVMGRDVSVVATNAACTKPTLKAIISSDDHVTAGPLALKVKSNKIYLFDAETEDRIYVK
jgi:hypothetical protein